MGAAHSNNNQDTLDWEKINTDSFSSNLPSLQEMNKETKQLIDKLDLQENINFEETESENSNIFAWLNDKNQKDFDNISELINSTTKQSKESNNRIDVDSGTSPFISSEDYENLANEKTSESDDIQKFEQIVNQEGGAINDTSTTSIGSVTKLSRRETVESDDSNLSYLSSSAHTEGVNDIVNESSEVQNQKISDYESSSEMDVMNSDVDVSVSESELQSEIEESTISPIDNQVISSEIKTTDINMLSSDK